MKLIVLLILTAQFAAQVVKASSEGQENSLVLSAKPEVWHIGDGQSIWLTMRYWGTLDGEKLTDDAWGDTKIVKEFSHQVRTFKNELGEGTHTVGPFRLDFQGREYESNILPVRVLPAPDKFRGIRAYFSTDRASLGKAVQLVVYEYRDDDGSLNEIELKENPGFEVYPHGGYRKKGKSLGDKNVWIQMRYFTLVPRIPGTLSITSESFHALNEKDVIPATLEVSQSEQGGTGQPATRSQSKSEGGDRPQPEAEWRSR